MNHTRLHHIPRLDDAVYSLAPAQSLKTDREGRFDLARIVEEGTPYRVVNLDGRHQAAFVVQPFGRALWITAAAGRARAPLCPLIDHYAVQLARDGGYEAVEFRTERRGLVARAIPLGYHLARRERGAYIMTKEIQ